MLGVSSQTAGRPVISNIPRSIANDVVRSLLFNGNITLCRKEIRDSHAPLVTPEQEFDQETIIRTCFRSAHPILSRNAESPGLYLQLSMDGHRKGGRGILQKQLSGHHDAF